MLANSVEILVLFYWLAPGVSRKEVRPNVATSVGSPEPARERELRPAQRSARARDHAAARAAGHRRAAPSVRWNRGRQAGRLLRAAGSGRVRGAHGAPVRPGDPGRWQCPGADRDHDHPVRRTGCEAGCARGRVPGHVPGPGHGRAQPGHALDRGQGIVGGRERGHAGQEDGQGHLSPTLTSGTPAFFIPLTSV